MEIVLDADVIIRGEKGTFDLKDWIEGRPDDLFAVAAITVAELWQGVERADAARQARRRRYLQGVLAPLPILPYTEQTAYEHARIWAGLAAALAGAGLSDGEARDWHRELRGTCKTLQPPGDKWK